MYNFIVNLFSVDEYISLLEGSENASQKSKVIIIPLDGKESIETDIGNVDETSSSNDILSKYSNREDLLRFLKANSFVNPTHNNANNIGKNKGLMSHSSFHFKLTEKLINADNDGIKRKIADFRKDLETTDYYYKMGKSCDAVLELWENGHEGVFPLWANTEIKKGDYLVFLPPETDIEKFHPMFKVYLARRVLKYRVTDSGICSACGKEGPLYMLTQGNTFDLGKDRKFLLRKPTRFMTNIRSKSTNDYPVCEECALKTYYFFEYLKKYKLYRFAFPTTITVHTDDYKDYSQQAKGILSMLKKIYDKNHSKPFDYILLTTDPKIKNIEFRYVSDFKFNLDDDLKRNIRDVPLYDTVIETGSDPLGNEWNKLSLLLDYDVVFNNTLSKSLFETNPKNLIKSLHPFLKLKIIEYNEPIRNFLFFNNASLFKDRIHTRMFRELLSELIENENFRDEMKIGAKKIRKILLVYYKYISLEKKEVI